MVLAGIIFLTCIITAAILFGGPAGTCTPATAVPDTGSNYVPVFTDPVEKLKELGSPAFTHQLYVEAVAYEPLLATPGTQVHMGFYSAKGNHGSLLRLLDAINEGPAYKANPPNRALWAQGVNGFYSYPSWQRVMNEHWYERAYPVNGTVMIFGKSYQDPHPVTVEQADAVWAQYSTRFAEVAEPIATATGKPVKAWCFIDGAKANRIFYSFELPALRKLEEKGLVEVYFAKTRDADWNNPSDWINGTALVPTPAV
jgi:hypothetical protein